MDNLRRTLDRMTVRWETRTFVANGHRHTINVSAECWEALQEISLSEGRSVDLLLNEVASRAAQRDLSSELELFVLSKLYVPSPSARLWDVVPANLLPC